jgi:hypothetical protein
MPPRDPSFSAGRSRAPGRARTGGPLLRRQPLYPLSYRRSSSRHRRAGNLKDSLHPQSPNRRHRPSSRTGRWSRASSSIQIKVVGRQGLEP